MVYVRRSKTDQDGTAADVRYLKNGCAARHVVSARVDQPAAGEFIRDQRGGRHRQGRCCGPGGSRQAVTRRRPPTGAPGGRAAPQLNPLSQHLAYHFLGGEIAPPYLHVDLKRSAVCYP